MTFFAVLPMVYMYLFRKLIGLARVCNHVADFDALNKCLTAKHLQRYRYHKLRKKHFLTFSQTLRGMAEKFVDTISIFNRKRNSVKMNISGFAKISHEQLDEIL